MKEITIKNAKKIGAHYSAGVLGNSSTLYISGQLPIDPVTREKCQGDVYEQTIYALNNVEKVIKEVGGDRNDIVKTTAFIDDMANWDVVNKAYAEFFGEKKPARTIACVPAVHFDFAVEIEAVAELTSSEEEGK